MAVTTNTIQTFDRKGLREDLTNLISNIDPTETPFYSNSGRGKCRATLHEWQTQALTAAATNNAKVQGDDWTAFGTRVATVRVGNYTQIAGVNVKVSGTVQAVDEAGRADEMDYQMMLMSKELKRDIEKGILSENAAGSAGNSSTAAVAAGPLAWTKTNVDYYTTDGGNPAWTSGVPSAVRTDGGTLRAFTESQLKSVLALGFSSGAKFSTLMVGPYNKGVFSAFSGVATKTFYTDKAGPTKIIGSADVYVGNFGNVAVVPNLFQRERDAWLIDFNMVSFPFLRPFFTQPLPKGDFDANALICEYTLEVKNEKGLGLVADLTTA